MQTTNMQIPTHENPGIGTVQVYEQFEKHITVCLQAKHQLQIESMLLDHDNQKFNLQTQKMELNYQKCQLEKKCQLLQSRIDLMLIMKNQYQMKCKYQMEEIDALEKSNQMVKNINVKLDEKIRQIQEEHQKEILQLNTECEKSVQDMSNKLKATKNQLKTTVEKLEQKINSLQNDKNELSKQVDQLRQQLNQSNTMYEKLRKVIMEQFKGFIRQNQDINQFNVLARAEEYIAKTQTERDSIRKLVQKNQKGKQIKGVPLAQKIQIIIQMANRQKTKIETGWNQFQSKLNSLLKMFIKNYTEQYGHQLLEVLETKIVDYESEISEKSSLIQNMIKQAKQVGKELKKIPEYEKQTKQLQQKLAQKQSILLEQKSANMGKMNKMENDQKITINNANKQRQKLQQRVDQLQQLIKTKQEQISEQAKEIEKKNKQLRQQKQAHIYKQEKVRQSMQKSADFEKQQRRLEEKYRILEQNIRQKTKENRKCIQQLRQLKIINDKKSRQLQQSKTEIQALKKKVQQANKKQNVQLQINKLNRQNDINNINKQLKQLRNRNQDLDRQVNRLNKVIRNQQIDMKDKQQRIQQGFKLYWEICRLAGTQCTRNNSYKINTDAIKLLEANLEANKTEKPKDNKSYFLTIPSLSKELGDDLDWVKQFISKDYKNKNITSNYLKTEKNDIDFNQYVGKTNIMMVIMTENNAVFMLMIKRIAKQEEKKTGNDTVFIVTKDKKRYPPQGSQGAVFPCVNKTGVLVLGKDNEILITKKLKGQIDFKNGGYFGEVDVQSMLNFTDPQKKEFKINQVEVYEIVQN